MDGVLEPGQPVAAGDEIDRPRRGCAGTPPEPRRPGQDPRRRPGPRTRAPALAPCPVTSDGASASKIAWQASELPELRQKRLIRWLCTCDTRKHSPPLPRTPLTCSNGPDSHGPQPDQSGPRVGSGDSAGS